MTPPAVPPRAAPAPAAPEWWAWALKELGVAETPGPASTDRILDYRRLAHVPLAGEDGAVPWCAIFVNAALESCGIPGTRSGLARSFASSPQFVPLAGPALGAVAVFWRGAKSGALGHVGFYAGESAGTVSTLGGNQGDRVSLAAFPREGKSSGLLGYFWPSGQPLPVIRPVHREGGGAPAVSMV